MHATAPDQNQFESSVLVQARAHAGRPCEVEGKNFVIALV
jgi:hypothetical protein